MTDRTTAQSGHRRLSSSFSLANFHLASLVVVGSALLSTTAAAQNDGAAGLFTTAGQLPLVSQSITVDVVGAVATTIIEQEFANTKEDIRQADYRLLTERDTQVVGFGFYEAGTLMKAGLKDKDVAARDHARAAASGRSTGLMTHDTVTHSFSVFPIKSGERKRVQVRLETPVTLVGGVASVRLPVSIFVGQKRESSSGEAAGAMAPPRTPIVARIATDSQLEHVELVGANATVIVARGRQKATVVGDTIAPVELQWRVKSDALVAHAYEVKLPTGRRGVEVAVTFADLRAAIGRYPRLERTQRSRQTILLVDGSASMRLHQRTLKDVLTRAMAQAREPIQVVAMGDKRQAKLDPKSGPAAMARTIVDGSAGHTLSARTIKKVIREQRCRAQSVRCVVVTDGQMQAVEWAMKSEVATLVLADPDDVDQLPNVLKSASGRYVFVDGASPKSSLHTLVDEVTLPALDVALASYGRNVLTFKGRPGLRVAEGGQKRFYADLPAGAKVGPEVIVDVALGGTSLALKTKVEKLKASSGRGKALRKSVYSAHLNDLLRTYDDKPSNRMRNKIVALSLREQIPTRLTAWHVEDNNKKRTDREDLGAMRYRRKTTIDFSDDTIGGDLTRPSGGALAGRIGTSKGAAMGVGGLGVKARRRTVRVSGSTTHGYGGLGTRGTGAGGGGAVFGVGGLGSGTGRGSGHRGRVDLGGRGKSASRVRVGKVMFKGSMSRESISRVMRRNNNQIRYCYEKQLRKTPELNGRLVATFSINSGGRVENMSVGGPIFDKESDGHESFKSCVGRIISRIRFPKPAGGGVVKVTYPFHFASPLSSKKPRPKAKTKATAKPTATSKE